MGENLSLVLGWGAMNKLNWTNILPGSALQLQPHSNRNYAAPGVLKKWEEGETTIPPPCRFFPPLIKSKGGLQFYS